MSLGTYTPAQWVALEAAVEAELIPANPARGVRVARRARTDEPWTWLRTHEIDALLDAPMNAAAQSAIVVALYSGIRQGESWGLRWGDVELDDAAPCLMVRRSYRGPTKGGKPRRVELLPPAAAALRQWRTLRPGLPAALVWPGDGGGCHARGFDADLWAILQRAGVRRVRWHDLRHTCASHLIQGTWGRAWSLTEIQQHLGHKSRITTERYAHLAHDGLRAAAAATPGHTRDTGTRGGHGR